MGLEFYAFDALFIIVPVIIFIIVILILATQVKIYKSNVSSPILSEKVRVVAKRTEFTSTMHTDSEIQHTAHTTYYITFENEAGQIFELRVGPTDYGFIVEGDNGIVTYQGTWFKKFERTF